MFALLPRAETLSWSLPEDAEESEADQDGKGSLLARPEVFVETGLGLSGLTSGNAIPYYSINRFKCTGRKPNVWLEL